MGIILAMKGRIQNAVFQFHQQNFDMQLRVCYTRHLCTSIRKPVSNTFFKGGEEKKK